MQFVRVGGAPYGGVAEAHGYVEGVYKKIGVCGGRSLYQHQNNSEIFLYYGCGRWFIGLQIGRQDAFTLKLKKNTNLGVCGGWVFTKTVDICVHGEHENSWQFIQQFPVGLTKDKSFKVTESCGDPPPNGSRARSATSV